MHTCQKIAVLMPENSQYGVLHHFSKKLFEAFSRKKISSRLFQAEDMQRQLTVFEPDLTVSFNGAPQDAEGNFLCDRIQKPHLSILVDAPYHYYDLLKSPYMAIACVDQFFCELLNSLRFSSTLFLPHAVEPEIFTEKPLNKTIDILMLATFIDYKKRMKDWKNHFPSFVVKSMQNAVEMTFADPYISYIEAFHVELNEKIKHSRTHNLREIPFFAVFREIELCIKGKGRLDLLQALQDHAVHLYCALEDAAYWKKALKKKTRFTFHPPIPYAASYDVMRASKIVLNSSPHIKRGGQERIFAGLACDACVVTAENAYLLENFIDQEELFLYKPTELDSLSQNVHALLQDDQRRYDMAQKGKHKVLSKHTWDHRAQTILESFTTLFPT